MAATEFHLDVEAIIANPHARMIISGLRQGAVTCFLQEGFGFTAGNAYGNTFESEALKKASDTYNKVGGLAEKVGLPSQIGPQPFFNTTDTWSGPEKPSFHIKTTFIAVKPSDDVTAKIRNLASAVFPTGALTGLMQAPLGYGPKISGDSVQNVSLGVTGTLDLKIGTWFQARGLIMRSMSPKFSSQVISTGKPLYCEVNIELKPYRAISYDEFLGYFIS